MTSVATLTSYMHFCSYITGVFPLFLPQLAKHQNLWEVDWLLLVSRKVDIYRWYPVCAGPGMLYLRAIVVLTAYQQGLSEFQVLMIFLIISLWHRLADICCIPGGVGPASCSSRCLTGFLGEHRTSPAWDGALAAAHRFAGPSPLSRLDNTYRPPICCTSMFPIWYLLVRPKAKLSAEGLLVSS